MKIALLLWVGLMTTVVTVHGLGGCCEPGWTKYRSSCYRFYNAVWRSHTSAESYCINHGAHLVTINDYYENRFLKDLWLTLRNPGDVVWIGLSDIRYEGTWRWKDGSTSSYTNWHHNQPNSAWGNQDCATMWTAGPVPGTWDDDHCHNRYPFFCEKSS